MKIESIEETQVDKTALSGIPCIRINKARWLWLRAFDNHHLPRFYRTCVIPDDLHLWNNVLNLVAESDARSSFVGCNVNKMAKIPVLGQYWRLTLIWAIQAEGNNSYVSWTWTCLRRTDWRRNKMSTKAGNDYNYGKWGDKRTVKANNQETKEEQESRIQ